VALDERVVLSVSPELFVEVAGGQATTRPMKGTAARAADGGSDVAIRDALAADPKQRAENLMIVDLLRNDLARISTPHSVRVPALCAVESYPTFHALTSTVTGRLRAGLGLFERIAALFPCGSIVGAPKIRAAEVIGQLEPTPRGVYTGAIGWIDPSGDLSLNVAIRTATLSGEKGRYGVGGGIVADSDPDAEYDEALLKARVLLDLADDFELIETLRWSATDGWVRRDGHMRRLAASAETLGFAFEPTCVEAALNVRAQAWASTGADRRVRVALSRDGAFNIAAPAIPPPSTAALQLDVALVRLDRGDPLLRHKTSRRQAHEAAFAEAAARGLDEAVLLNRRGLVADGSRNSLFIERDGRLVTPRVSDGALPGVLRAALLADGRAVEGPLSLADLALNPAFVGNSLHGLRPAVLAADRANQRGQGPPARSH
jgi:para-aminobenzoate synthetase/4-amino-4-deoxychorismate lyase